MLRQNTIDQALKTIITSTNLVYDSESTTTNDVAFREISSSLLQTRQFRRRHGRGRGSTLNKTIRGSWTCRQNNSLVWFYSRNSRKDPVYNFDH